MDPIIIRRAGAYEITSDGTSIFCNGVPTAIEMLARPITAGDRVVIALVDTYCQGANGKRDKVSLTQPEYDAYRAAAQARRPTPPVPQTAATSAQSPRQAAERRHDALYNEGGEGYNPHRYGAAKTYR